jgi:hypothetical protein
MDEPGKPESNSVEQLGMGSEYRHAFEKWKAIRPIEGIDAAHRLSREECHDRGGAIASRAPISPTPTPTVPPERKK